MWLWCRALCYMFIVGGGWLIMLPAFLLFLESGSISIHFRSTSHLIASCFIIMLGAALALWAGYHLIQHGYGTPLPLDPTSVLVTTGPYHFVRNPQSIGMMLMVLGELLAVESSWLWLMLPLTIFYLEGFVGPLEHRQLVQKFGGCYQSYVKQVPKWLPRCFSE